MQNPRRCNAREVTAVDDVSPAVAKIVNKSTKIVNKSTKIVNKSTIWHAHGSCKEHRYSVPWESHAPPRWWLNNIVGSGPCNLGLPFTSYLGDIKNFETHFWKMYVVIPALPSKLIIPFDTVSVTGHYPNDQTRGIARSLYYIRRVACYICTAVGLVLYME